MESFNASCAENQVIVMRTARYGRMKIGRCVKGELNGSCICLGPHNYCTMESFNASCAENQIIL